MNRSHRLWLEQQIAAGHTDSSLVQRFHNWLLDSGKKTDPVHSIGLFLATGIKCREKKGRFIYGFFRVLPEPQQPPYAAEDTEAIVSENNGE